eukprot:TRINITY_DN45756_c0_g2_i1.p1 TRINITY_DN45756_c0_g2~~TRINITY_DN45756_c0_g2_i1.p1  ORF type:complete len:1301 (+),score=282.35 TRINITY_DN45756_c0_g2_i1:207-4109(+)
MVRTAQRSMLSADEAPSDGWNEKPTLFREVFPWIPQEEEFTVMNEGAFASTEKMTHAADSAVSAAEVAARYGAPVDCLMDVLHDERQREQKLLTIPFTFVMFFAFCVAVLTHDPVVPVRTAETAVSENILGNAEWAPTSDDVSHKDIFSVASIDEFWDWLDGMIAAKFEDLQELAPIDRKGLLGHNDIVGGLRIQQERTHTVECSLSLRMLQRFVNFECVGSGSDYTIQPGAPEAYVTTDPQRTFWLYAVDGIESMQQVISLRRDNGWTDYKTRKVEAAFFTYNSNRAVHTVTYANFYQSEGGQIWVQLHSLSTFAQWYKGRHEMIPDWIWGVTLLYLFGREVLDIYYSAKVMKGQGARKRMIFKMSLGSAPELFAVAAGVLVVVLFYLRYEGTQELKVRMEEILNVDILTQPERYRLAVKSYTNVLEHEVISVWYLRVATGFYPIAIIPVFLKVFAAQPRLALITNTLEAGMLDLIHFSIVFIPVWVVFSVAAVVWWGVELDEYISVPRACFTSFRIILGDFDYDELADQDRMVALAWFLPAQIGLSMLMLNILLSILLEAYSKVHAEAIFHNAIWTDAGSVITYRLRVTRGALVAHKEMMGKLAAARKEIESEDLSTTVPMGSDFGMTKSWKLDYAARPTGDTFHRSYNLVSNKKLQSLCENLPSAQAKEVVERAVELYHKEHFATWNAMRLRHELDSQYELFKRMSKNVKEERPLNATFLKEIDACTVSIVMTRRRGDLDRFLLESVQPAVVPTILREGQKYWELKEMFQAEAWGVHDAHRYEALRERKDKMQEMMQKKEVGEQIVQESLIGMSELEWRLFREQQYRHEVAAKMKRLKSRTEELKADNENGNELHDGMLKPISEMMWSRNEFEEVFAALEEENKKLRKLLAESPAIDNRRIEDIAPFTNAAGRAKGLMGRFTGRQTPREPTSSFPLADRAGPRISSRPASGAATPRMDRTSSRPLPAQSPRRASRQPPPEAHALVPYTGGPPAAVRTSSRPGMGRANSRPQSARVTPRGDSRVPPVYAEYGQPDTFMPSGRSTPWEPEGIALDTGIPIEMQIDMQLEINRLEHANSLLMEGMGEVFEKLGEVLEERQSQSQAPTPAARDMSRRSNGRPSPLVLTLDDLRGQELPMYRASQPYDDPRMMSHADPYVMPYSGLQSPPHGTIGLPTSGGPTPRVPTRPPSATPSEAGRAPRRPSMVDADPQPPGSTPAPNRAFGDNREATSINLTVELANGGDHQAPPAPEVRTPEEPSTPQLLAKSFAWSPDPTPRASAPQAVDGHVAPPRWSPRPLLS